MAVGPLHAARCNYIYHELDVKKLNLKTKTALNFSQNQLISWRSEMTRYNMWLLHTHWCG